MRCRTFTKRENAGVPTGKVRHIILYVQEVVAHYYIKWVTTSLTHSIYLIYAVSTNVHIMDMDFF